MADQQKDLVDAYPVPDVYVEHLGSVEMSGNNVRLTFATARKKFGGDIDHEIVARVVLPVEAIGPAVYEILKTARLARAFDGASIAEMIKSERSGMLQ